MKMKELKIGQSVMTLDEEGSPAVTTFLGWLHKDTNLEAEFLEITTEDGHKITLTPTHIIMVNSEMKLASQVVVGDLLTDRTGAPTAVISITKLVTKGVYSPLTMSSTILVNNILASCFAATPHNSQAHFCFGLARTFPWLLEDYHSQDMVIFLILCSLDFSHISGWCSGISSYVARHCWIAFRRI